MLLIPEDDDELDPVITDVNDDSECKGESSRVLSLELEESRVTPS